MAYALRPDGSLHCDVCGATWRAPQTCKCPRSSTVLAPRSEPGEMERLTAQADDEGMLNRLGCERLLAARIRRADEQAVKYGKLAGTVRRRGALRIGREGAVEADEHKTAQGWDALAEQARNRGDKLARALHAVVADRERRADLERRERGVEAVQGKGRN